MGEAAEHIEPTGLPLGPAMEGMADVSADIAERLYCNADGQHISELPIDHLDISQFHHTAVERAPADFHGATRFIMEATFGPVHEEPFEATYENAIGRILAASESPIGVSRLNEEISNLFEHYDEDAPRLTAILDYFRSQAVLDSEAMSMLTRITLLVARQYS